MHYYWITMGALVALALFLGWLMDRGGRRWHGIDKRRAASERARAEGTAQWARSNRMTGGNGFF